MLEAEGPRYDIAAQVAAQITNLLSGDYPGGKSQLFSRVLFLVLEGIYEAEERLSASRYQHSEN
jgi:hypothetical protein